MKGLFANPSFRRVFSGYLLVLLLPVLAGLLLSGYFARSISRAQAESSGFAAERLSRNGDALLGEAALRCRSIAADETLKTALTARGEADISADLRYAINRCSALLGRNDFFSESYIYFRANQSLLCLGDRVTGDTVERVCAERLGMSTEELWQAANAAGISGGAVLREIGGSQRLLYLLPAISAQSYQFSGVVIGVVDEFMTRTLLGEYPHSGRMYLFCGDRYLYGDAEGFGSGVGGAPEPGFWDDQMGERVTAATHASADPGVTYAVVLPNREYNRPVRVAMAMVGAYGFLCLAVGGVYALARSRKEYAVVDRFLSLTSSSTPEEAVRAIQRSLRRASDHRRELETVEHDRAREKLLSELLLNSGIGFSAERMKLYGVTLDRSRYGAAVFFIDSYENLFFGENQDLGEFERADTAFLIVRSVTEELCGAVAQCCLTRLADEMVALLSFDCPEEEIDRALASAAEFIEVNFGLRYTVRRGKTVRSLTEIRDSCGSAYERQVTEFHREAEDKPNELADRVRRYVDEHYANPQLGLGLLAEELGFSVSHLSHAFKESMGITVLSYIQSVRITEGKRLLRETRESVGAIALQVGYSGGDSFTRAMRKFEGITPGEYRRMS